MNDACLIEFMEHQSFADAAEIVASEASTWLGYQVFSDAASVAIACDGLPKAMLENLADVPIAWDRVTVTTTDEHRVPETHPASNIGFVRGAFAGRWGSQAQLVSLDRHDVVSKVKLPLDLLILSVGTHGDITCLPPCASSEISDFEPLIDCMHRPSAIELPVAARRWSLPVLASCRRTLLLCDGPTKRAAIERALVRGGDGPLGYWFRQARGIVTIHWAET